MSKKYEIRNSTTEFLIFQIEGKEDGVQVVYHNESVWCTQKTMAQLFGCSSDNIWLHLKNIYDTVELAQEATTEYFSVVQTEDERQVNRKLNFYNLDAIISVGSRVNSTRAMQFRDKFLELTDRPVLTDAGKITAEFAKSSLNRSLRNIVSFRTNSFSPTSTASTMTTFSL